MPDNLWLPKSGLYLEKSKPALSSLGYTHLPILIPFQNIDTPNIVQSTCFIKDTTHIEELNHQIDLNSRLKVQIQQLYTLVMMNIQKKYPISNNIPMLRNIRTMQDINSWDNTKGSRSVLSSADLIVNDDNNKFTSVIRRGKRMIVALMAGAALTVTAATILYSIGAIASMQNKINDIESSYEDMLLNLNTMTDISNDIITELNNITQITIPDIYHEINKSIMRDICLLEYQEVITIISSLIFSQYPNTAGRKGELNADDHMTQYH